MGVPGRSFRTEAFSGMELIVPILSIYTAMKRSAQAKTSNEFRLGNRRIWLLALWRAWLGFASRAARKGGREVLAEVRGLRRVPSAFSEACPSGALPRRQPRGGRWRRQGP